MLRIKHGQWAFAGTIFLIGTAVLWYTMALRVPLGSSSLSISSPVSRIPFIANRGQFADTRVAFRASMFHGVVYITRDGEIVYRLPAAESGRGWTLKEYLVGNIVREPQGITPAGASVSFFRGTRPEGWRVGVPTFERVSWGEVYPNVQLTLRVTDNSVEKLLTVLPGGDPKNIRWHIAGAHDLKVTANGELEATTGYGPVRFTRPVAFQENNGLREPVAVSYWVDGMEYGFTVGAYDASRPLVIDPLLAATYLGSSGQETNNSPLRMVRDPATGDILIAGATFGADFPTTTGAYDETFNAGSAIREDVFIARMSSDLSTLIAATFLGGTGADAVRGLALDSSGNIYIGGDTNSPDFPTTAGAIKTSFTNIRDTFVAKLTADLSTLTASTLFGDTGTECVGTGADYGAGIAVDSAGNVYLAGFTTSRTLPVTVGAYQTTISEGSSGFPCGQDAFVAKLDSTLTSVVAATYYGTGGQDNLTESVVSIALDGSDNVYIAGWAPHSTLPVTVTGGDFAGGPNDTFVAKFSNDLTTLIAARYAGGSGQDVAKAAAFDPSGNFQIIGGTTSSDFPTTTGVWLTAVPPGTPSGTSLGFAIRLSPALETLAATYLHRAAPNALAFDGSVVGGELIVAGASSSQFPYPTTAYDPTDDGSTPSKVFVGRFSSDLTQMFAATTLRGQCGVMCAVTSEPTGNVFIAGSAAPPGGRDTIDLTTGAYDTTFNGGTTDVFVTKLSANLAGTPNLRAAPTSVDFGTVTVPVTPSTVYPTADITLDNTGDGWLNITSVTLGGADPGLFAIDNNTCTGDGAFLRPQSILPNENRDCVVSLSFEPLSVLTTANWTAQLQVASTDPDTPVTLIPLTGSTFDPSSGGGSGSSGGGCFIATAAYGSYLAPEVKVLREFRDNYLLPHRAGKQLVEFYYQISPPIAEYIQQRERVRTAVRWALTPVVYAVKNPITMLACILFIGLIGTVAGRYRRQ